MSTIVTLAQFQTFARNELAGADDAILQACIDAAEPLVKDYCERDFMVASAASDRTYSPPNEGDLVLRIHDCTTVNTVTVGTAVRDSASYQTEPLNKLSWSGQARPIEQLRSFYYPWLFYGGRSWININITVNATWGWASIPPAVTQATLITARDIYVNRNAPVELSHMIMSLLDPYRRAEAFGIG